MENLGRDDMLDSSQSKCAVRGINMIKTVANLADISMSDHEDTSYATQQSKPARTDLSLVRKGAELVFKVTWVGWLLCRVVYTWLPSLYK